MNDLFYFIEQVNLLNYADDNSISVNHAELHVVSRLLQAEADATVQWFSENSMQANPAKFQGISLKGNKYLSDFKVSIRGQGCLKANRQISALQRLTGIGLLNLPNRKAIYTSFIFSFRLESTHWHITGRPHFKLF